jgi:ribonucleoside-diphosphate reductase beta chain
MECSKSFNLCNLNTERTIKDHLCFFDPEGGPSVQRTDVVKHQSLLKLENKMLELFWRPQEIPLTSDVADFKQLSDHQRRIFTETLLRAVLLDSIQSRSPSLLLLPIVSIPELELMIQAWSFTEGNIHSNSYAYMIKSIYPNPDVVFDQMKHIEPIVDCSKSISLYYDKLHEMNIRMDAVKMGLIPESEYNLLDHKQALWDVLVAVNGLESLRFYAAFATFFSFAEQGMMMGSARILSMIARDEEIHCAGTSQLIYILPKEDPDFAMIKEQSVQKMADIYNDIVEQELEWVKYIFKDGTMLGLNEHILGDYVKHLSRQKMLQFGVPENLHKFKGPVKNPIPWINQYTQQGSNVQIAPQEESLINYTTGAAKNDLDGFSFEL